MSNLVESFATARSSNPRLSTTAGFGGLDSFFVVSVEAVCARAGETTQMAAKDNRTSAIIERFTGSLLQSSGIDNNPALSPGIVDDGSLHGWQHPWAVVGVVADGSTPQVFLRPISAYTGGVNWAGATIALPASAVGQGVPAIPYPANVTP